MSTNPSSPTLPSSLRVTPREPPLAEITRKLLDYLLSGEVEPGTRIPGERNLAEALGVGRSAVREAIKSLSLLGLLEVRQGDGTYLSRSGSDLLPRVIEWGLLLKVPSIMDLLEARTEIEIVAAGLAATRAGEAEIAVLRERLDAMRRAVKDVDAYVEADIAFHLDVARAGGNEVLANLVTSLRALLRVWVDRVLRHAGENDTSLAMHEPIVEAIAAGDAAAAREAMRAHMERANRRLREALEADAAQPAETGATSP
ncbi:MAG TPA: FadR/GntR family transcriptional regulator [Baekduia sp.]|uniref:FadR/GntR family transcriptional regulator n=1 Tax=Baekduia sp. TaxID=2600305 RepID=UPI002D79CA25|nr:FadR/GntR family transcriptional regulator [Baekduia sp.]HET6507824.1 FadR/GntR family transcriptional regulator [Baekduia sp.]